MNEWKKFKETSIGTKVMSNDERPLKEDGTVDWKAFDEKREEYPICIDFEKEMVSFKMMTKPASEGGSGAQATDLIEAAAHIIEKLNEKLPCNENKDTLHNLNMALAHQRKRTLNRINRGVEGKNEK